MEGGREVVQVRTQQPVSELGDYGGLRVELFQHAILLFPNGELETKNRTSRSCGVGSTTKSQLISGQWTLKVKTPHDPVCHMIKAKRLRVWMGSSLYPRHNDSRWPGL